MAAGPIYSIQIFNNKLLSILSDRTLKIWNILNQKIENLLH